MLVEVVAAVITAARAEVPAEEARKLASARTESASTTAEAEPAGKRVKE
jgi:hypothetical protein